MSLIERDQQVRIHLLSENNHRSISRSQRKVGIVLDQLCNPRPVLRARRSNIEAFQATKKTAFHGGTVSILEQIGGLGDTESGNQEPVTRILKGL